MVEKHSKPVVKRDFYDLYQKHCITCPHLRRGGWCACRRPGKRSRLVDLVSAQGSKRRCEKIWALSDTIKLFTTSQAVLAANNGLISSLVGTKAEGIGKEVVNHYFYLPRRRR